MSYTRVRESENVRARNKSLPPLVAILLAIAIPAAADGAKIQAKPSTTPSAAPSKTPPENSVAYFCLRHEISPDTTPELSAEASIRVDVWNNRVADVRGNPVNATATLFHLKLYSVRGTLVSERRRLVALGKFKIEPRSDGKGHHFVSEQVRDSGIKAVEFSLRNSPSDPSYVKLSDGRSFFMLCRSR